MDEKLRIVAFFDLDLTITNRDSFRYFLKKYYLGQPRKMLLAPYVFFYGILRKLRLVSLQKFKEKALVGLRGCTRAEIDQIGSVFFEEYLKQTLRDSAIAQIKSHQENGDLVYIVSASPNVYVRAVSKFLGCDGFICSNLHYNRDRFTGDFVGGDCIGEEKKIRILAMDNKLDFEASWAYSDHEADLPFLELVGHPVVVCPTENLKNIAVQRNWPIYDW